MVPPARTLTRFRTPLASLLMVWLACVCPEAAPMSAFNPKTCVFSSVKARLTLNGQPLKRATVIRRWEWQQAREDRTTTDDEGWFSFAPVFESSATRLLPIEFVVGQSLDVVVDGHEKSIWSFAKRKPEENAELKGKPIVMRCELTQEAKARRENGAILSTMCVLE